MWSEGKLTPLHINWIHIRYIHNRGNHFDETNCNKQIMAYDYVMVYSQWFTVDGLFKITLYNSDLAVLPQKHM